MNFRSGDADASATLRRRSKWDEAPAVVPELVLPTSVPKVVEPKFPVPTPPPGVGGNSKVLKLEGIQIRALIGKGGENIKGIRAESGADIKIEHTAGDLEGTVSIVGEVEKAERLIRETLMTKGCPVPMPRPGAPESDPNVLDVTVPPELVGPLMGPGGANMKDVRDKAGGAAVISILAAALPGGPQHIRVVGDNRDTAASLIKEKIQELKSNPDPPSDLPTACTPLTKDVSLFSVVQAEAQGRPTARSASSTLQPRGLLPIPAPPPLPAATPGRPMQSGLAAGVRMLAAVPGAQPPPPPGQPPASVTAQLAGVAHLPPPPPPPPLALMPPSVANAGPVQGQPPPPPALGPQAPAPGGAASGDWLADAARAAALKLQVKEGGNALPAASASSPEAALQAAGMEGLASILANGPDGGHAI